jgi:hypothetical protein
MPRDSKQGKVIGRDGEFSQWNRSSMDHSSLMLIMSCYTGFFKCEEGGNLSTQDLGFIYVSPLPEGVPGVE